MKVKHINIGFLFATVLLLQLSPFRANGQVLEHAFSNGRGDITRVVNSTNGLKYVIIDSAQINLKVYNRQYILERSIALPNRPPGFQSASYFLSTYFDALVPGEVVVVAWYYTSLGGRTINHLRLVDHNGSIRLDLPDFASGWIYADPGNPPVFACSKMTFPVEWRVYRLPGTMVNLPSSGTTRTDSQVFPNPTSDLLRIDHGTSLSGHERVLEVYDQRGQLVNKVIILAGVQSTEIDTRSWPPGIYQYSIQGSEPTSGRFIVE